MLGRFHTTYIEGADVSTSVWWTVARGRLLLTNCCSDVVSCIQYIVLTLCIPSKLLHASIYLVIPDRFEVFG